MWNARLLEAPGRVPSYSVLFRHGTGRQDRSVLGATWPPGHAVDPKSVTESRQRSRTGICSRLRLRTEPCSGLPDGFSDQAICSAVPSTNPRLVYRVQEYHAQLLSRRIVTLRRKRKLDLLVRSVYPDSVSCIAPCLCPHPTIGQ